MPEGPLLWGLVAGGVALLACYALLLWDISRSEVRHLPRWAWALVVVLITFPIGALLYLVVGRVPAAERAPTPERADRPGTEAPPPPPPAAVGRAAMDTIGDAAGERSRSAPSRTVGDAPSVVATRGLTKRYGDTVALDQVDLAVPRGATYGLIGPNGAGKTTMLSILAGLRHPTAGGVELGVERRRLAVLVDTPLFEPWLTAREVVDLARSLVAPDGAAGEVDRALEEVGLADAADRRCGGFSRGMLQRLGLATCLVGDPEVLLLDEPSSALDPAGRREVLDLIGRLARSTTVILSTHILADVQQVCDVVGVIDHGRLRYQGPIADLLARTSSAYHLHVRGAARPLLEDLRRAPWVRSVEEQAPGRLRFVTDDATRAEQALPGLLADSGVALVSCHPATDLETAFLELTR
ncbi:MAG: ATP-binding cassette domain-containing protein [Nitriliruptoraceae bacterium]